MSNGLRDEVDFLIGKKLDGITRELMRLDRLLWAAVGCGLVGVMILLVVLLQANVDLKRANSDRMDPPYQHAQSSAATSAGEPKPGTKPAPKPKATPPANVGGSAAPAPEPARCAKDADCRPKDPCATASCSAQKRCVYRPISPAPLGCRCDQSAPPPVGCATQAPNGETIPLAKCEAIGCLYDRCVKFNLKNPRKSIDDARPEAMERVDGEEAKTISNGFKKKPGASCTDSCQCANEPGNPGLCKKKVCRLKRAPQRASEVAAGQTGGTSPPGPSAHHAAARAAAKAAAKVARPASAASVRPVPPAGQESPAPGGNAANPGQAAAQSPPDQESPSEEAGGSQINRKDAGGGQAKTQDASVGRTNTKDAGRH